MDFIYIFVGAVFVNNFVLSKFLGMCPFFGVTKRISAAFGMGMAVTFVMVVSGLLSYMEFHFVLVPLNIKFLDILVFILTIAVAVQFLEIFLQRYIPALYQSLGIYLPLITANCAVLGVTQLNILYNYDIITALVYDFSSGIGFALALVLMAGIREKLEYGNIPRSFQGAPIAFIIAGLMSLAFLGFSNIIPK